MVSEPLIALEAEEKTAPAGGGESTGVVVVGGASEALALSTRSATVRM